MKHYHLELVVSKDGINTTESTETTCVQEAAILELALAIRDAQSEGQTLVSASIKATEEIIYNGDPTDNQVN